MQGLVERAANNPQEMFTLIQYGNSVRTTHATSANDTSSRSHAICIVFSINLIFIAICNESKYLI